MPLCTLTRDQQEGLDENNNKETSIYREHMLTSDEHASAVYLCSHTHCEIIFTMA